MNVQSDTVRMRLARYRRSLRLNATQAAALIAEVTIYAAVKFGSTIEPEAAIFGAIFLTLVIVCGGLLAWSRGKIEWEADLLDRYLDSNIIAPRDLISAASNQTRGIIDSDWPRGESHVNLLALCLTLISAIVLLVYIWFVLLSQGICKSCG